jgi:hypothetical protein
MIHTYSLSLRHQLYNCRWTIIHLIITIIIISQFIYVLTKEKVIFIIFYGYFFLYNIKVILIHLIYWIEDKNKVVTIDTDLNKITTIKKGQVSEFNFDYIKSIINTSVSKYKSHSFRTPNIRYYYYQIYFKNNKSLIITSLSMKDEPFPMSVDYYRYRGFPSFDDFNYDFYLKKELQESKEKELKEYNELKEAYKSYTKEELYEIISNKDRYNNIAVKVAEELINN